MIVRKNITYKNLLKNLERLTVDEKTLGTAVPSQ